MKDEYAAIRYEGIHCSLIIERPGAGIAVLRLSGSDTGEFGEAPMQELAKDFARANPLELFIDARSVKGASTDVSSEWAQWLGKHRWRFQHISMLTGTRFIQMTANFVRRFAELGDVMKIYTDPVAFDAALERSLDSKPDLR